MEVEESGIYMPEWTQGCTGPHRELSCVPRAAKAIDQHTLSLIRYALPFDHQQYSIMTSRWIYVNNLE